MGWGWLQGQPSVTRLTTVADPGLVPPRAAQAGSSPDRANIIFRGYTVITVGTWNLENLFRPGDARPESATTYQGVMSLPEQPSVGQALGLRRS